MTARWKTYFETHGAFQGDWLATAVQHWGFHETLYGMIQRHCPKPARLLDVGCGPGWSDLYLTALGYDVLGIDNEVALVERATTNAQTVKVPARFAFADAFDLSAYYNQFDLAFSCGVLEHFDRSVTVELLREQSKAAKRVLIEIPTKYTAYADGITDERIYSVRELRTIVEDAGLISEASFGYGDLGATAMQRISRQVMPRGAYRLLQNSGFAYSIAVIGRKR